MSIAVVIQDSFGTPLLSTIRFYLTRYFKGFIDVKEPRISYPMTMLFIPFMTSAMSNIPTLYQDAVAQVVSFTSLGTP